MAIILESHNLCTSQVGAITSSEAQWMFFVFVCCWGLFFVWGKGAGAVNGSNHSNRTWAQAPVQEDSTAFWCFSLQEHQEYTHRSYFIKAIRNCSLPPSWYWMFPSFNFYIIWKLYCFSIRFMSRKQISLNIEPCETGSPLIFSVHLSLLQLLSLSVPKKSPYSSYNSISQYSYWLWKLPIP